MCARACVCAVQCVRACVCACSVRVSVRACVRVVRAACACARASVSDLTRRAHLAGCYELVTQELFELQKRSLLR